MIKTNPFLKNFPLKVLLKQHTTYEVEFKDIDTSGRMAKEVKTPYRLDTQKKTNVYYIPYIENVLYDELSPSARDVFLYIIYRIPENQDWIELPYSKLMKMLRIKSNKTIATSLQLLVDNAILIKKSQSAYWVNPHYVFKGNRLKFYEQHCNS